MSHVGLAPNDNTVFIQSKTKNLPAFENYRILSKFKLNLLDLLWMVIVCTFTFPSKVNLINLVS